MKQKFTSRLPSTCVYFSVLSLFPFFIVNSNRTINILLFLLSHDFHCFFTFFLCIFFQQTYGFDAYFGGWQQIIKIYLDANWAIKHFFIDTYMRKPEKFSSFFVFLSKAKTFLIFPIDSKNLCTKSLYLTRWIQK